jgi:hypothetical protein
VIVLKLKANHSSFACFGGPIGQLGPWGPWTPTGPHGGLWALYIYIHILCIYVYVSIYIHIQRFSAIYFVGCFQDAIKKNAEVGGNAGCYYKNLKNNAEAI